MCIRNPWGQGEWTGDWSDYSELWNIRMQNLVGYKNADKDDGLFWMDYEDFLDEFSEIYVCRVYNEKTGWKEKMIEKREELEQVTESNREADSERQRKLARMAALRNLDGGIEKQNQYSDF